MDHAIHTPVFPRDHWYLVSLEDLFAKCEGDYEERERVIRQQLGLGQCGLVEDA